MLTKMIFKRAILTVLTICVLCVSPAVFAKTTAYNNYDTATSPWYYTIEPLYEYNEQGSFTHYPSGNGSYPAGNNAFGGCMKTNPPADVYHINFGDIAVITGDEGTIELWFAPDWNGTNQGGPGIGGSGATQDFVIFGSNEWVGPFNVFIFNNNLPDDGGQLFAYWNDGSQSAILNNSVEQPSGGDTYGTTKDWVAGEWHHIAFCWDVNNIGLYLDGGTVAEVARTAPTALGNQAGGYFFGLGTGGGPINSADGWFDDLTISDHSKYTPDSGGPYLPTGPQMVNQTLLAKVPHPNDQSINASKYTDLDWERGIDVVTHKVYFDSVESNVQNRLVTPIIVNEPDSNCMPPVSPLVVGQTYYWAVDEVNAAVTYQGNIWQFTVETGLSINPAPYNDQMDVHRYTDLSWDAAPSSITHSVYFDSNATKVQNRSITPAVISYPDSNCPPLINHLESNAVYYWAIDSVDDTATTHSGDVWKFTTERKAIPALIGDLGKDYEVNFKDIGIFVNQYLDDISPWNLLCAELNNERAVDNSDYALMAGNFSESDIPLGFKVLGTIVPPEYDPPPTDGFTEVPPDTYTGYYRPTPEEVARGYLTYVKNYMDNIYPITTPQFSEITNQLSSFSAPGEYEPVTFTIYTINDINDVSATVSDLTGPAGSSIESRNIEVRSVRCWPRRVWQHPPVNQYIVSPWFLEKRDTLDIDSGTSKRYWITIWVPADAAAGTYNGTVTINALKAGSPSNYALDLELDVLDIELMAPPTIQGMTYHAVDQTQPTTPPYSDEYYYKEIMNMKEHGMNNIFMMLFPNLPSSLVGPNVVYDLSTLDSLIEDYHDAGFRDVIWNTSVDTFLPTWSGGTAPAAYPTNVKGFHDQLLANGWNRPVASTMDETDALGNFDVTNQYLSQLKSAVPEMKTYTTIVYPENSELFEPYLDIRSFSSGYIDGTVVEPTRAAGRELWTYAGSSESCKIGRFYRGIWGAVLGLDGNQDWVYFHVYDCDYLFDDLGATGPSGGPNHRGYVFPTPGGPLPTPAWEGIREGTEDRKYFYTLEKLIKQANESGDAGLITLASNAQSYLDSLYAQIDTSPSVSGEFPCSREGSLISMDFLDDARIGMATHIQAISDALDQL